MQSPLENLEEWSRLMSAHAKYDGLSLSTEHLPRIDKLRELLRMPVPGSWLRDEDDDHRWANGSYRRGDYEQPRAGEHQLEKRILDNLSSIEFLGGRLVDGVNAFPLAIGKTIEADLLLLGRRPHYEMYVVEAKWSERSPWGANDPWYAVVENLKQLVLLGHTVRARSFFSRRPRLQEVPELPNLVGVVLAPAAYYTAAGKRRQAVAPALELVRQVREDGFDVRLCCFDQPNLRVFEFEP